MKQIILFLSSCVLALWTVNNYAQEFEIYVSDAGNFNNPPWQILKFDQNGENPEVFIDTNIAWPQDIVFLEDQEVVLISSLNSGLITKHNVTNGAFIENFASGIGGPTRMKIGDDGLLYVLQWQGNGLVWRYELDGTFVDEFTDTGVPQSIGLDWDSAGNLYVSSFTGDRVEKFDPNGNFLETFIDANLLGPTNIWFDDNGDLLVIDYNDDAVKRFDSDGNYIEDYITGINFGEGVAFFPNGTILIGDGNNAAVNLYASNGSFIEQYIPSGSGELLTPNAVILRDTSVLSTSEPAENTLAKITPTQGDRFTITSQGFVTTLDIYTVDGRLMHSLDASQNSEWDASGTREGLYFVVIKDNAGNKEMHKIIVQHL